jgi:UDP-N-acetylglucosamine acyltransferase
MPKIHPSAIVETGAILAGDVEVGPYAFISAQSTLGNGVCIHQGAQICGQTTLGDGVEVYQYAIIGTPPQDLGYKPEDDVGVNIGKNTIIREFVTINAGTRKDKKITRIGENCFIMIYCHIGHDCQVGDRVIMANNATLAGHVHIGSHTVIGGMTPIHQFVHVGEGCMIGGASAISQDIPPFCLAEGNRAIVRGLNAIGLRRRFDKDTIKELKSAFRFLFRSNGAIKTQAKILLEKSDSLQVQQMCQFILNTKRGIPYERVEDNEL